MQVSWGGGDERVGKPIKKDVAVRFAIILNVVK